MLYRFIGPVGMKALSIIEWIGLNIANAGFFLWLSKNVESSNWIIGAITALSLVGFNFERALKTRAERKKTNIETIMLEAEMERKKMEAEDADNQTG